MLLRQRRRGVVATVRDIEVGGRVYYQCEECALGYATRPVAEECEAFCARHNACSLEIAGKAVYVP